MRLLGISVKRALPILAVSVMLPSIALAQPCVGLPDQGALETALMGVQSGDNGGFGLDMWGTIVDRDGVVCAVAKTGGPGDQWPGSRVISAQKANTANAFSLPGLAISTANLFSAVQPGGPLFGLQESNPVNAAVAYEGDSGTWGTANDPLAVNEVKIGGVNVFGGGLALYDVGGNLVGAIGVSGDTSCADHAIAWRTRAALGLDLVPAGPNGDFGAGSDDNIIYDIGSTQGNGNSSSGLGQVASASGWGHPHCLPTDMVP